MEDDFSRKMEKKLDKNRRDYIHKNKREHHGIVLEKMLKLKV